MYNNRNQNFQNANNNKRKQMEDEMSRFEKEISVSSNGSGYAAAGVQTKPSMPAMFIPPQIQRQQQQGRLMQPPNFTAMGALPPRPILPAATGSHLPPPLPHHPLAPTVQPPPPFLAGHPAHLIRPPPIVNPPAFKPMLHQQQPFIAAPAATGSIAQPTTPANTFKPASYTVTPIGLPTNVHNVTNPVQASAASAKKQKTNAAAAAAATTSNAGEKKTKKPRKIVRIAGGQTWEDPTLQEWDTDDFRIFCGDLGNDVNEDILTRAFNKYPSFVKCKVIRDKRTNKSKGYGFISFKEPSDFIRAMRDMDGKYVGSRPIKLRRSNWKDRNIEVVKKKMKEKQKLGLI